MARAQPDRGDDTVHARRARWRRSRSPARSRSRTPRRWPASRSRQIVRPGAPVGLRRLHLQRRHAVGRAGVRHARVHAHGDGRRPARPPLQPAVPQQQRVRRQRGRRAGRVRVGVLAVGRDHGRRQHDDARRRLDGGRAARQLREDDASTPTCCTWCRRCLDPLVVDDATLALEAIDEVGPGGHFFGTAAHPGPLPHRVLQADDLRLAQLRVVAGGRQPRGGRRRPTDLEGDVPGRVRAAARWTPPSRGARSLRRPPQVAEGGVATDF